MTFAKAHAVAFWTAVPMLSAGWLALYIIASVKAYRKGTKQ
jgi:hypothetical protein